MEVIKCITNRHLDYSLVFVDLQWKAVPIPMEKKFDDPEQIPIPDFSVIVDRCLHENKSQEVWDMVRILWCTLIVSMDGYTFPLCVMM